MFPLRGLPCSLREQLRLSEETIKVVSETKAEFTTLIVSEG